MSNKYTAEIGGSSWNRGPVSDFNTIRAARLWAEEYGTTADYCVIKTRSGRIVAKHQKAGDTWFRAAVVPS